MTDGWLDDPVRIVRYDRRWPARFEAERGLLESILGSHITGGVHHVGSTAVEGLEAKPVIDISVVVGRAEIALECVDALAAIDYMLAPWLVQGMHWFCKPHPRRRTHHLHFVTLGSPRLRNELAFRDALRSDPALRDAYAKLKRDLARRYEFDRRAYSDAKGAFIAAAIGQA